MTKPEALPPIKSVRFTQFHNLGVYNSDRFTVTPGELEAFLSGPLLVVRVRREVMKQKVWSSVSIPVSGGGIAEIVHEDVLVEVVARPHEMGCLIDGDHPGTCTTKKTLETYAELLTKYQEDPKKPGHVIGCLTPGEHAGPCPLADVANDAEAKARKDAKAQEMERQVQANAAGMSQTEALTGQPVPKRGRPTKKDS